MSDNVSAMQALATQLKQAWPGNTTLVTLDPALCPADTEQAYAAQDLLIQSLGSPVSAWKVGAKTPDGPALCAPLPASGVQTSPAIVHRSAFGTLIIELELAFRLDRAFAPSEAGYSADQVMAAVGHVVPTIELVSTRYAGWPKVDKLALLADLQSHGGLIVGTEVPYDAAYPFERPGVTLVVDGQNVTPAQPVNPAGDPRRLVPWLVNHLTARGQTVEAGSLITAGSYTGMYALEATGDIIGRFDGLPEIRVSVI